MKNIPIIVFALILLLTNCVNQNNSDNSNLSNKYQNIEFEMEMVQEPVIPAYEVNILDFGAVEGGEVLNTDAIGKAIEAVVEQGGGKVVIPAGIWLTGPIILKSNLELHAESGALIRFSTNKDLYPIIETSFEGINTWRCLSPIYGKNLENIAFTGSGIWDGSGDAWRKVSKSKLTESQWEKWIATGGVVDKSNKNWYPSEQFMLASKNADQNIRHDLKTKEDFEAIRDFLRPVMLSIQNSKRVLLDGPVFQNSPAWCLHPFIIEDLIVRNITVRNPWYSQNGDGIDIESCKNVIVENSQFDVGDDAICIKSGKDKDGRLRGIPCENLIIRNNVVFHGHGGVTVGSEMSSGVKNMHVSNCTFIGTDVGLRFKSTRGRGGIVENIFISSIRMTDILTNAISFNLYYGGKSVSEMMAEGGATTTSQAVPVSEETPQFRNISLKNITISGAYQAVFLQGLPEMNIENVEISNLLAKAKYGFTISDADGVKVNNIKIQTENSNVFNIFNSKNVQLNQIDFKATSSDAVTINGGLCEKIELTSSPLLDFSKITVVGENVPDKAISIK